MKTLLPWSVGALLACMLLPSCRATSEAPPTEKLQSEGPHPDLALFSTYRSWHRANEEPVQLTSYLDWMCKAITRPEAEIHAKDPHRERWFSVYVSETGKTRLLHWATSEFPVGTVVVKEKHATRDFGSSELLTVMIKREPGYAPEDGDWQYIVAEGMSKSVVESKTDHCRKCHMSAQDNDFVFADYVDDDGAPPAIAIKD